MCVTLKTFRGTFSLTLYCSHNYRTMLCRKSRIILGLADKVGNFELVPYRRYIGSTIGKIILPVRQTKMMVQEKLLTVTLVTVTQYRASWLQWHFSDFPISNIIVKFSCLQWHSISHSLTVTLFGRSRGCHCNRLLLYLLLAILYILIPLSYRGRD